MKKVSISGSPRADVGKKDAKKNRKQGLVPCVLYGGTEQFVFTVEEKVMNKLFSSPEVYTISLDVEKKKFNCVIQDTQFHPVTDRILHVDFLEIFEDKPVIIEIPIKLSGTSPGVLSGGRLQTKIRKLKVRGLYPKLPDFIELNISELEIGDSIKVSQMVVENVEFLNNANSVIVMVKLTRAGVSALDGEEGEEGAEGAVAPAEGTEEEKK